MCELCGCGSSRAVERDARIPSLRGKPINVRIVAITTRPKATGSAPRDDTGTKAATIRRGETQPIASGGA